VAPSQQVALHVGPLRSPNRSLVIVDPIVSIALSVWLFDERFKPDAAVRPWRGRLRRHVPESSLLTQTAPATMKPDPGE
jgi:hypothetical protein